MIECVLFDCDGTLVESEFICNKAIAIMFEELGVQLDTNQLLLEFRGGKMDEVLAELCARYKVNLLSNFLPRYRALVSDLFDAELAPIEGVVDMLAALDMPMAVVSNGPKLKIMHALDVCGLRHHFKDNIYSAYELQCWKPDGRLYLAAAKNMGFLPSQCAVIEDSPTGVQAGINANMTTCYYDKLNQPFDHPNVIHFKSMHKLLDILKCI